MGSMMHATLSFDECCEGNAALHNLAILSLAVLAKGAFVDDMFAFSVIDSLSIVAVIPSYRILVSWCPLVQVPVDSFFDSYVDTLGAAAADQQQSGRYHMKQLHHSLQHSARLPCSPECSILSCLTASRAGFVTDCRHAKWGTLAFDIAQCNSSGNSSACSSAADLRLKPSSSVKVGN